MPQHLAPLSRRSRVAAWAIWSSLIAASLIAAWRFRAFDSTLARGVQTSPRTGVAQPDKSAEPAPVSRLDADRPPVRSRSVTEFGAKGDGVADDSDAFARALAQGGVHVPPGAYRITRTLEVDLEKTGFASIQGDPAARIVMAAAGPALRFLGTHGGTADPTSVAPNVWQRQRMPSVSGFEITGAHPEADAIEARGTMQFTATNMLIRNVRHGIRLVERNRNVLIANCHVYDNSGVGIFLDHVNLHQTNIGNCHVSYNRAGGVVVRGGEVRNVHITGCDIEANMAPDAPPTANVLFDCADGTIAEAAIVGCTIQHEAKSPDSANIRILGRGTVTRRGEKMAVQCGHVTISDNVLSDVQVNVHLDGVRGATITGNTFWQGYQANLIVERSTQIVVGANVMERNPLYGYTSESRNGVVIRDSQDCSITGLHLHNVQDSEAGLLAVNCRRLLIANCTILDCDKFGLLLRNVSQSRVTGCLIRDDRDNSPPSVPLLVEGGEDNRIESPSRE